MPTQIQVFIKSPAAVSYDITGKLISEGLPDLTLQIEEDAERWVAGDMTFSARNEDGFFDTIWPLPLDPQLVWNESLQNGCWYCEVWKNGAMRFNGDLDVMSVAFGRKTRTVSFAILGKTKRAERSNAALVKRPVPSVINFTVCAKGKRRITLDNTVASYALAAGDKLSCTQLSQNGAPVQQDLEIKVAGPDAPNALAANQVLIKGYPRKAYSNAVCHNPWYRGKTVAFVVQKLFESLGLTVSKWEISGPNSTLIVDEADFDGKTVADALTELAAYSSSLWFTTPEKWFFIGRSMSKLAQVASPIDDLVLERTDEGLYDRNYLTIVVKGSKERFYRVGRVTYPKSELEISTDFTSKLTVLQAIGTAAFSEWGKLRIPIEVELKDDGTAWELRDLVSLAGQDFWINYLSEPLRAATDIEIDGSAAPFRASVVLRLLQVNGTAPATADDNPHDDNTDYDPPQPPINLSLGKGTDAPSGRPPWWTDGWNGPGTGFRSIYSGDWDEWPIVKEVGRYKNDQGEMQYMMGRLWVVRFQVHPDNPEPNGWEFTAYKAGKDPSKPAQQHGTQDPLPDADGWYYFPWYKTISDKATDKECVLQHYDIEKGLSCYSDPVSTNEGGLACGVTFTSNDLLVTFSLSASGGTPITPGVQYAWSLDCGDGTIIGPVTGTSPHIFTHLYPVTGTYNAVGYATDNLGNTASVLILVTVAGGTAGGGGLSAWFNSEVQMLAAQGIQEPKAVALDGEFEVSVGMVAGWQGRVTPPSSISARFESSVQLVGDLSGRPAQNIKLDARFEASIQLTANARPVVFMPPLSARFEESIQLVAGFSGRPSVNWLLDARLESSVYLDGTAIFKGAVLAPAMSAPAAGATVYIGDTLTATFTCPGGVPPHSWSLDWGDGSAPSTGSGWAGTSQSVTHVYGIVSTSGGIVLSLRVTDSLGATATLTRNIVLATRSFGPAYPPNGGNYPTSGTTNVNWKTAEVSSGGTASVAEMIDANILTGDYAYLSGTANSRKAKLFWASAGTRVPATNPTTGAPTVITGIQVDIIAESGQEGTLEVYLTKNNAGAISTVGVAEVFSNNLETSHSPVIGDVTSLGGPTSLWGIKASKLLGIVNGANFGCSVKAYFGGTVEFAGVYDVQMVVYYK